MAKKKWIICPVCKGEGTTVNPNIDSNGLTAEDFAEDPDFAEEYMSGTYDQQCAACQGTGKIHPEGIQRLQEAADARRLAARENGDWEGYCGANDWRYGYN